MDCNLQCFALCPDPLAGDKGFGEVKTVTLEG